MIRRFQVLAAIAIAAAAAPAAAQTEAPAHVSRVDGQATIARVSGAQSAVADLPVLPGDRIQTDQGRLELLFGDGSLVHLDDQTTVDVNAGTVVRLLDGRLVVATTSGPGSLQVDAAPASVRLGPDAEARVSLEAGGGTAVLDVGVVRGQVEVVADTGATLVGAGERVAVSEGEAPGLPMAFNSAGEDGFYRWSNELLDSRRGTTSASYLPGDLVTYGSTFDQYGTWAYQASYGYVWYPRVAVGWRPYDHGRWAHVGGVGWTFVGQDPWGWPTHHYGRWGLTSAGAWFWIPTSTWSAAWVEWAVAPGYVGWCPLGPDDRPVGRFWTGGAHQASYNGHRGWSVVRSSTFTRGGYVRGDRVDPAALRGPTVPAFAFQRTAPQLAVPRGTVSIPSASVAVPRGTVVLPSPDGGQPGDSTLGRYTRRGRAPEGSAPPAGRGVMRTPAAAPPPVVYYRGSSISPEQQRSPAPAYDRGGVAVPRGPVTSPGAVVSPYGTGGSRSPYAAGSMPVRGTEGRPVMPVPPGGGAFLAPGARPVSPVGASGAISRGAASGTAPHAPSAPAPPAPPASAAPAPHPAPQGSGQGGSSPRSGNPRR